jgi:hypothetical protein
VSLAKSELAEQRVSRSVHVRADDVVELEVPIAVRGRRRHRQYSPAADELLARLGLHQALIGRREFLGRRQAQGHRSTAGRRREPHPGERRLGIHRGPA